MWNYPILPPDMPWPFARNSASSSRTPNAAATLPNPSSASTPTAPAAAAAPVANPNQPPRAAGNGKQAPLSQTSPVRGQPAPTPTSSPKPTIPPPPRSSTANTTSATAAGQPTRLRRSSVSTMSGAWPPDPPGPPPTTPLPNLPGMPPVNLITNNFDISDMFDVADPRNLAQRIANIEAAHQELVGHETQHPPHPSAPSSSSSSSAPSAPVSTGTQEGNSSETKCTKPGTETAAALEERVRRLEIGYLDLVRKTDRNYAVVEKCWVLAKQVLTMWTERENRRIRRAAFRRAAEHAKLTRAPMTTAGTAGDAGGGVGGATAGASRVYGPDGQSWDTWQEYEKYMAEQYLEWIGLCCAREELEKKEEEVKEKEKEKKEEGKGKEKEKEKEKKEVVVDNPKKQERSVGTSTKGGSEKSGNAGKKEDAGKKEAEKKKVEAGKNQGKGKQNTGSGGNKKAAKKGKK